MSDEFHRYAIDQWVVHSRYGVGQIKQIENKLIQMLRHWLLDHVLKDDLRMKPYLSQYS